MFAKLGRKATPLPSVDPQVQTNLILLDIRRGQEDLIKRIVRVETRLVRLLNAQGCDQNGNPLCPENH